MIAFYVGVCSHFVTCIADLMLQFDKIDGITNNKQQNAVHKRIIQDYLIDFIKFHQWTMRLVQHENL